MEQSWQRPVTAFVLFNLIGVPLIGRGAWLAMQAMRGDAIIVAVALSVAAALAILGVNAYLAIRADRAGVPQAGRAALWGWTALSFLLPIGTGFYSPLTLIHALLTW